jgi:hypothetical protein
MDWDGISSLLPAILVLLLLFKKRAERTGKRETARRLREGSTFRRDYDPIEPS